MPPTTTAAAVLLLLAAASSSFGIIRTSGWSRRRYLTVPRVDVLPVSTINSSTALALYDARRWRRFVRFPPVTSFPASAPQQPYYQPPWQSFAPQPPQPHPPRPPPVMGQRSPRLVFRDPDVPGTIHASSTFYQNNLQDLSQDEPRGM